jgi:hypothetical protein
MKSPLIKAKRGRPPKIKQESKASQSLSQSEEGSSQITKENEEIEKIAAEHEEAKQNKPKRRSYKNEVLENEKRAQDASKLTYIASTLVSIIISRISPDEPLSDVEKKYLDESFTDVLSKYAERFIKFSAEIALLGILALIFFPRLKDLSDKKKNEQRTTRNTSDFREDRRGKIDAGSKDISPIQEENNN